MTAVAALYSGGRDSTLAALLLAPFYDVTLCSCTFGIEPLAEYARPGADALGLPLETVALEESVAREATERMIADGYPRRGIQRVHEHALETVAAATDAGAVADGTRRDDRVPVVDRSTARSLEDRRGIDYLPAGSHLRGVEVAKPLESVVHTPPFGERAFEPVCPVRPVQAGPRSRSSDLRPTAVTPGRRRGTGRVPGRSR